MHARLNGVPVDVKTGTLINTGSHAARNRILLRLIGLLATRVNTTGDLRRRR